jgi:hypothetical protein
MGSWINHGEPATIACEFNACKQAERFGVVHGIQRPRDNPGTLHTADDNEVAAFFSLELGNLSECDQHLARCQRAYNDARGLAYDFL